jgi:hypothetical protein
MAASEGELGKLHEKVAKVMSNAINRVIEKQEQPDIGEDGNEIEVQVNPALLSVAVKFLDANKITCAPEKGNSVDELRATLERKQQMRKTVGNVVHLVDEA